MDCNMPGFPIHHQLLEFTQIHVHQVGDAMGTISSSVIPCSSCLQSFPASGSLPVSQFFMSGSQSIGVSASPSVLPMNIQDWFPLGWTGLISLQPNRLLGVFSNTAVQKHLFFWHSAFFIVQLSHPSMTPGKTIALTRWTFVGKVMSLLFNMLSRLWKTVKSRKLTNYSLWAKSSPPVTSVNFTVYFTLLCFCIENSCLSN